MLPMKDVVSQLDSETSVQDDTVSAAVVCRCDSGEDDTDDMSSQSPGGAAHNKTKTHEYK